MTTLRDVGWKASAALAAALLLTLLLSLASFDPGSVLTMAALIALVILAARYPATALLVLATLIPVASWLGRRWNGSVAWAEALVIAFAAGYCARQATNSRDNRTELDLPLLAVAAVVVASMIVQFLVDAWRVGGAAVRADLWWLVTRDYLLNASSGGPIDAAMRLLESLVLVRAAATAARADTAFGSLMVKAFVFGAAAAGVISIMRLWEGAMRLGSPIAAFARYLLSQRFNAHYGDLNAAGSYYIMATFPALGLFRANGARWGVAALSIAIALWITGSRMALVAGVFALIVPAVLLARRWISTTLGPRRSAGRSRTAPGNRRSRGGTVVTGARDSEWTGDCNPGPVGDGQNEPPHVFGGADLRRRDRAVLFSIGRVRLTRAVPDFPTQRSARTPTTTFFKSSPSSESSASHPSDGSFQQRPSRVSGWSGRRLTISCAWEPSWVCWRSWFPGLADIRCSWTSRHSRSGSSSEPLPAGAPRFRTALVGLPRGWSVRWRLPSPCRFPRARTAGAPTSTSSTAGSASPSGSPRSTVCATDELGRSAACSSRRDRKR